MSDALDLSDILLNQILHLSAGFLEWRRDAGRGIQILLTAIEKLSEG